MIFHNKASSPINAMFIFLFLQTNARTAAAATTASAARETVEVKKNEEISNYYFFRAQMPEAIKKNTPKPHVPATI